MGYFLVRQDAIAKVLSRRAHLRNDT